MRKTLLATLLLLAATRLWAADFNTLDRAQARHLAAAGSHSRPTIVALWASDCAYCKKNLNLFAALAKADKGVRIISVATEPESAEIKEMLDKIALPGERYAYGSDAPEALAYALDPAWRGELPRTLLFDGKGGRTSLSGTLDEGTVRRAFGLSGGKP